MASIILSASNRARLQRTGILVLLWAVMAAALWLIHDVLLPFGIAVLLAYVLHPAVTAMSRWEVGGWKVPRWVATLALYACMALVMVGIAKVFIPQVTEELSTAIKSARESMDDAEEIVSALPAKATEMFAGVGIPVVLTWDKDGETTVPAPEDGKFTMDVHRELQRVGGEAKAAALEALGVLAKGAQGLVGALVGFIFKIFLVLMLTAFMLSDVERIREWLLSMVPVERRESMDRLLHSIDTGLAGVVRGQLTICAVNGVLTLFGLVLIGVKFAFLMGLVAGVLSLVPIFGSIVSSIPIVAVALTGGLHKALLALGWILGIHALEANLLNPKIMGSAARIHPVLVVLVLVAGEHFYGFTGALFAVPCTSVLLAVFKFLHARALKVQDQMLAPPE